MDNSSIISPVSVQPVVPPVSGAGAEQKSADNKINLIKTIVIIALALVAATFIGLFIWMLIQYNEVNNDVNGQISSAVLVAKDEQAQELEAEFLEREKDPYRTFSGPVDYGQLTFKYPKTWSVYIASDASSGGDFSAYFNPIQVNMISKDTINALRVVIRNRNFDDVVNEYQKYIDRKDSNLSVETITIADGVTANRYSGNIPGTDFNGLIVIFKIRDKTAVLQTDSVLFESDFNKILETVEFNA